MSAFNHMANTLRARSRWPTPSRQLSSRSSTELNKTEFVRQYLQEQGAATAADLAMAAELERTALVGALLKADIKKGQVLYAAGKYHWNAEFDQVLPSEIHAACALLRRHGYRVHAPTAPR